MFKRKEKKLVRMVHSFYTFYWFSFSIKTLITPFSMHKTVPSLIFTKKVCLIKNFWFSQCLSLISFSINNQVTYNINKWNQQFCSELLCSKKNVISLLRYCTMYRKQGKFLKIWPLFKKTVISNMHYKFFNLIDKKLWKLRIGMSLFLYFIIYFTN